MYDSRREVELAVSHPADPPIGQRIREERLRQGINLRSLARSVNVSASHISQIETGKCRPSVSTLYAITTVLGVAIDDIFDGSGAGQPPVAAPAPVAAVVPGPAALAEAGRLAGANAVGTAGQSPVAMAIAPKPDTTAALAALASAHGPRLGPVVGPGNREVLELDSGVTWERLGHVPGLHVDFLLITYAPGSRSSSTGQLMRHAGTEYGYLISGQLTVTLGFTECQMTAGDAICFPSSTPHRYRNEGAGPAIGVWLITDSDAT